jgi:hypothetical protein
MSLYGRTDSNTNKTKAGRGIAASSQAKTIVFVDETEAQLNENRTRGIDGPGWWSYFTYTDAAGNTRHKAEKLVALGNPDTNANETQSDDTIAADVASAVTINVAYPQNATTSSGGATFTVNGQTTTTGTPGTLVYQWQVQTTTGTRWTNVTNTGIYTGSTTHTLTLTGATSAVTGYKYRVKITSAGGTEEVISRTATLTFGT